MKIYKRFQMLLGFIVFLAGAILALGACFYFLAPGKLEISIQMHGLGLMLMILGFMISGELTKLGQKYEICMCIPGQILLALASLSVIMWILSYPVLRVFDLYYIYMGLLIVWSIGLGILSWWRWPGKCVRPKRPVKQQTHFTEEQAFRNALETQSYQTMCQISKILDVQRGVEDQAKLVKPLRMDTCIQHVFGHSLNFDSYEHFLKGLDVRYLITLTQWMLDPSDWNRLNKEIENDRYNFNGPKSMFDNRFLEIHRLSDYLLNETIELPEGAPNFFRTTRVNTVFVTIASAVAISKLLFFERIAVSLDTRHPLYKMLSEACFKTDSVVGVYQETVETYALDPLPGIRDRFEYRYLVNDFYHSKYDQDGRSIFNDVVVDPDKSLHDTICYWLEHYAKHPEQAHQSITRPIMHACIRRGVGIESTKSRDIIWILRQLGNYEAYFNDYQLKYADTFQAFEKEKERDQSLNLACAHIKTDLQFYQYTKDLLSKFCYTVLGRDQEVNPSEMVLYRADGFTYYVRILYMTSRVDQQSIMDGLSSPYWDRVDARVILSNADYTPEARDLAETHHVQLLNGKDLGVIKHYATRKKRIHDLDIIKRLGDLETV
ncbi:restriction endonuclease [Erysipelothrix rhusiopathiae]|nr:restriction endonuclease [Erysipelothrix rhusiopathiae]